MSERLSYPDPNISCNIYQHNCSDVLLSISCSPTVCAKIQLTSVVYTLNTRSRAPRLFWRKWRFFSLNVLNPIQNTDSLTDRSVYWQWNTPDTHYTVCVWNSMIQSAPLWKCQLLTNNRSDNQEEMAGEGERERRWQRARPRQSSDCSKVWGDDSVWGLFLMRSFV